MKKKLLQVLLLLIFSTVACAQSSSDILKDQNKQSLIKELSAQIDKANVELSGNESSDPEELKLRLKQLELEFEKSVVGQNVIDLYAGGKQQKSLEEEIMNILQPVFGSIKETTTSLREKEDIRIAIEALSNKKAATNIAMSSIERLISQAEKSSSYKDKLEKIKSNYQSRIGLTNAQLKIAEAKLEELKEEETNPIQSISDKIGSFISTTGIHLIVSLLAAVFFFFGVSFIFNRILQLSKSKSHNVKILHYQKIAQLEGVIFLVSVISSFILIFVLFLFFNNWFLISIYVLILLVLFWAIKDKITGIIENMRLVLNIGAVREQERIIYEGLPYEVEQIKFYTRLKNPKLEGGRLRVPIDSLLGMSSRRALSGEAFFPTSKGDWVLLDTDEPGRVEQQTVEYVKIRQFGGSLTSIPTRTFLEMNPTNLTSNGFRVNIIFGIDYKHQSKATTEIQQKFEDFIRKALIKKIGDPKLITKFFVLFTEANSSSLDYIINAELSGELAYLYGKIPRYLQGFAVDACNEYGWEIPFTQIQIHGK